MPVLTMLCFSLGVMHIRLPTSTLLPAAPDSSAPPSATVTRTWLYVLLLAVAGTTIYIGNAFWPALLDDADASHALVVREMLQRGDWVVMYLNGIRYLMKAPLHYWMVGGSYLMFGQNEFATRLPAALCMVLLALMSFEFGRRFFSETAGLYGGLVSTTSLGMFIFTRIMIPEAVYALLFTALFYLFLRAWTGSLEPRLGYWGVAALMALAVLARGLIGVVLPLGVIAVFITLMRGWRRWRDLHLVSSTLIFLALALPWHVLAELRAPGFLWSYFINEHVNRALGTRYPPDYDAVPLGLWWIAHLAWLFPWSIFLPLAFRELPGPRPWKSATSPSAQARLLLFTWVTVILGFFSLIGGSRLEYYSFGAWPGMAILLGLGLARGEQQRSPWLPRLQLVLAALGVLLAGILGVLVIQSRGFTASGDISQLLEFGASDSYRLSMGHLFDLTPRAFANLRAPALGAALSFAVAFVSAYLLRRRGRALAASLAVALGMTGFMFSANLAYRAFEPHMSSKPLAREIQKYLRPGDKIVFYGEFNPGSSLAFYTHQQVLLYNGRYNNNLEYGSYYPDAPRIFLTDADFAQFWQRSERVFLFVEPTLRRQALARLSRLPAHSVWLLTEIGGKQVFVNQALTPGQPSFARFQGRS